ncbi:hypothetical protein RHGRI_013376 [Rhododendron griersonianum]|uniref:Uncharacterized protein n=1 Tax=Rhododendron griersonianum TaxID=479676 RepID=A0AAV6K5A5_9ERIC|nr:hypothetical protein RHGRI_013376 [Rhododendron griersonianum]
MAKKQVDRAEPPPPPPSVVNDSKKSRGIAEHLVFLAFLIERFAAAILVLSIYWFPPDDWGRFLLAAIDILILTNSLYLISLFSSLLKMAADRYDANATEVVVIGAVTLVIATCVAIIETLRTGSLIEGVISVILIGVVVPGAALLADERKKQIDKENTGQQEAKLDFSSKESKEEVQAKEDEMNNKIDEEFTRQQEVKFEFSSKESKEEVQAKDERNNIIDKEQQKAKLDVSLKESKEELRSSSCCSTSEEFQCLEAKYHAKYENLLRKYFDKCHGWEEERSQLMKELGAARASSEIYRELLHGSDDFFNLNN